MKIQARSVYRLIVTTLFFCGLALAEDGVLLIHVSDADDKAVTGVVLSNKGDGTKSDPTNDTGVTRMALSGTPKAGNWIHLQVLNGTKGNEDWILISPWDGRVAVPPFDGQPDRFISIVLAKKFDKRLLANPTALRAMAASINNESAPKTIREMITEGQRRVVLAEVAKGYGLGADEMDKAIRAWGEKTKDPYEIGLAALYAKNYSLANEQLSKSLEIRRAELEKEKAEVADSAFFLGQSLYGQGLYRQAVDAFREAAAQRPDDATIINYLAMTLIRAGSYAEAEPLSRHALAISENAPGLDHSDVAFSLYNLALLYYKQGKYAQAEPLFKRTLVIGEKELEPDDPVVARLLNNLSLLYVFQGKYAEAEPLLKRALAINEKALGPDHSDEPKTSSI